MSISVIPATALVPMHHQVKKDILLGSAQAVRHVIQIPRSPVSTGRGGRHAVDGHGLLHDVAAAARILQCAGRGAHGAVLGRHRARQFRRGRRRRRAREAAA